MKSYARGPDCVLIEKTIDQVFRGTVARDPGHEALLSRHQAILAQLRRTVRRGVPHGRRPVGARHPAGRPRRDVGLFLRGVGVPPTGHGPYRGGAGQRQPQLPRGRPALHPRAVTHEGDLPPRKGQPRGLPGRPRPGSGWRGVAARARGASGNECVGRHDRRRRTARAARTGPERCRQHSIHFRDHGKPQGGDAHSPEPAEQRLPRRKLDALERGGPPVPRRADVSLLRVRDGFAGVHGFRRDPGDALGGVQSGGRHRGRSTGSAARRSTECRRCSSRSWNIQSFPSTT